MELRELAETVLEGGTLAEKLVDPGELSDAQPGVARTFTAPARSGGLSWSTEREVPASNDLRDPAKRAALLHAFANHELLAVELFALMLVRFPEAPAAFRRGLAQTLLDEQRHLGLYVARLRELGVEFGSQPLSRYLWDAMAEVPDPLRFVTTMSLTFEQANIDHMRSTAAALREVGDVASAEILEQIGDDEVQHVALGLRWFERWRAEGPAASPSTWGAYRELLPPPLTPRRARGNTVWETPRIAAGLSADFVRELKVFSSTRGRPSRVRWFDPACELRWAGRDVPQVAEELARDLAGVVALLAQEDDVVLAPRPSLAHLESLQRAGFVLPEFSELAPARLLGEALPWGWTPEAVRRCEGWQLREPAPNVESWGSLFAKDWAVGVFAELDEVSELNVRPEDLPRVETSWADVGRVLEATLGRVVVKDPFGASGRGQLRSDGPPWEKGFAGWVGGVLRRQGRVVVQPWFEGLADFSCLLQVQGDGVRVVGCTRFRTDRRGQYRGHDVGSLDDELDAELRRALHGEPGQLLRGFAAFASAVGERLAAAGYRGPAGVDAVLTRLPQGLALVPLEVNPRHTFGHVAWALSERLVPGRGGAFALLPRQQALAVLRDPARCVRRAGTARLEAGALALTDPAAAARTVAVLVAAERAGEAWLQIAQSSQPR